MLVVRHGALTLINVHAESNYSSRTPLGINKAQLNREAQLEQMAAYPDEAYDQASVYVLAGDFNMHNGGATILEQRGWVDAGQVCKTNIPNCECLQGWTWRKGATKKNYDRIFLWRPKGEDAHFQRARVL